MSDLDGFRQRLREKDPDFDRVEAALDQFAGGEPVTERCAANGERIVVERSDRLGKIRVRAGDLLLRTMTFKARPDSEGPLWRSSEDSSDI